MAQIITTNSGAHLDNGADCFKTKGHAISNRSAKRIYNQAMSGPGSGLLSFHCRSLDQSARTVSRRLGSYGKKPRQQVASQNKTCCLGLDCARLPACGKHYCAGCQPSSPPPGLAESWA